MTFIKIMIYYIFKPTNIETISGAWSDNTLSTRGILKQILVKFKTSSTIFDLVITDANDLVVLNRTGETGNLSEIIELPLDGIYTISIENATVDEEFDLKFYILEK